MKTIGLLGGTGWGSTVGYYRLLNEEVQRRLGGFHSARIILKSIDYHDIKMRYGQDDEEVARLLQMEFEGLLALRPDCVMICCNTLHRFYGMIRDRVQLNVPMMHAVELVAEHAVKMKYSSVLLLGTQFTMEDGFFARTLERNGIAVTVPDKTERVQINKHINHLIQQPVTEEIRNYFQALIQRYQNANAVILGCTEIPLAVDESNSVLPIIDPVPLQVKAAVDFALG